MRTLAIRLATALGLLLILPAGIASAHVLKVDGDIGAVLHINPDDNPTSGTPIKYVLSFDDTTGRFSLPRCTCTATITGAGTTVIAQPLVVTTAQVSEDTVTFPKPDVYMLTVNGKPKTIGAFQSFALSYLVRVTSGNTAAQPFPLLLGVGITLSIGLILLAAYVSEYSNGNSEH
jgi:hypothetical protein